MNLADMFASMSRASLEELLTDYRGQLADLVPVKDHVDGRAFIAQRIEAITVALGGKAKA